VKGRLVILDKTNTIMAVFDYHPNSQLGSNFNVPQYKCIEGIFSGTHGSAWDANGERYVQD